MRCENLDLGDGTTAIVCTTVRRRRAVPTPCGWCTEPHTLLCDGPTADPMKSCDARLCQAHTTKVSTAGDALDVCPRCIDVLRPI